MRNLYIVTFLTALLSVSSLIARAESSFGRIPTLPNTLHVTAAAPARTVSAITAMPSPGVVSELSEIRLLFVGAQEVSLRNPDSNEQWIAIYGKDDSKVCPAHLSTERNLLTISFSPAINLPGTYTLIISSDAYKVDGESLGELRYTYVISQSGETGILYTAPEGEMVKCQSDFLSYFVIDGNLYGMPIAGKPLHYVKGDDGNLYLYNIITLQPYGGTQISSYILGTPSGENKWRFSFPQPVYEYANGTESDIWYMNYLYTYVDGITGNATYKVYQEDNSVEFIIDADGNAKWINDDQPGENSGFAIGATGSDNVWTGFANVSRSTYQKFTAVAPDIHPAECELWKLTTGPQNNRSSRNVNVYFDGNDVWIKGFSKTYLPDAWAHGVINGKKITLDAYLGECDIIGQYLFLYGSTDTSGKTDLTFKYYPEEKGMTYNGEYIINPNQIFYYAVESYEYPVLEYISSGIEDVEADHLNNVVQWFTLDGRSVAAPDRGVFIRRTINARGEVIYDKVIL